MDMALEAAAPRALAHTDGSGWTRCARTLAISTLAAATLLSGTALATRAAAAGVSRPETVIVRGQAGCAGAVATTIAGIGGRVTHSIGILNGAVAVVNSDRLSALRAAPCVAAVTPDGSVTMSSIGGYDPTASVGSLYNTEQIVGAQAAWADGATGQNVGVAVLDTGVSPVQGLNAPGKLVNGPDLSFASQSPALTYLDEVGHGTHIAGIIAGRDQTAPSNGGGKHHNSNSYAGDTSNFNGVAPDARIVNVKVADEQGAVDVSQVLAGIDWVVQHRNDGSVNIRVLNLSFGTNSTQSYILDPLAYAAEIAWKSGIVVVTSAGNNGAASNGLNDPAYDPFLISVGAADTNGSLDTSQHTVAAFSSNGTTARTPDVVAPGVHIASLRDPGSQIDLNYGATATTGSRFFLGSGTSQAAAVVSGAAALLVGQNPGWSPDQVKYALTASATPLANQAATAQGSGEINVEAALGIKMKKKTPYTQMFLPATGLGSLDASRGGVDVTSNGVALTGEKDIMGNSFNSATMAAAEATQAAWNDGTWNGAGWAGAGWAGAGWAGAGWAGVGWAGAGWAGAGWAGSTWTGAGWAGAGWAGAGWAGAGWAGAGWAGAGWAGAGWAGAGWAGAGWAGAGWADDSWS
jgi:serine protease AprX